LHISSFKTLNVVINYLNNFELKTKKKICFHNLRWMSRTYIKKKAFNYWGYKWIRKNNK
jgi:hypothetical protein